MEQCGEVPVGSGLRLRLRRAAFDDLPALRALYAAIVADMRGRGLDIWDDVYPCCALDGDVARGGLWLFEGAAGACIADAPPAPLAVFALAAEHPGSSAVRWREPKAEAVYLDRLGVDPAWGGRGVGRMALASACGLAREQGAAWLRLFVVDANMPAIRLYEKCGCLRAPGCYVERVAPDFELREYGYELAVR